MISDYLGTATPTPTPGPARPRIGLPSRSTINSTSSATFIVTYSTGSTVVLMADGVSLNTTGDATCDISVISGTTTTPSVQLSACTGNGTVGITIAAGTSTDANAYASLESLPSNTFNVDNNAPTLTVTTPLNGATAIASNYTAFGVAGTCESTSSTVTISATDGSATAQATASCSSNAFATTVNLSSLSTPITISASQTDAALNTGTSAGNPSITKDIVGPTVAVGAPSLANATKADTITFGVTYTGGTTFNLTAGGVTLNTTGTATCSKAVTDGTTATPTVTLTTCTGNGTIGITIAAGTSTNALTNPSTVSPASATFAVENLIPIYYSIGKSTSDHSSGGTVTVAEGIATFSVAQTSPHLGAGDRVRAGANVSFYLASKISTTEWNVITQLGAPAPALAETALVAITHEFTSLSAALVEASNWQHLNSTNLVSGHYVLNLPCYSDSEADTSAVTIDGWTTGANNYIKIYTPADTTTEVNTSQRHNGKWDDHKYRLVTSNTASITIAENYVKILGLQIHSTAINGVDQGTILGRMSDAGTSEIEIGHNILRGPGNSGGTARIDGYQVRGTTPTSVSKVYNNVIYDFASTAQGGGITTWDADNTTYAYNNTIVNCSYGLYQDGTAPLTAINNLLKSCNTAAFGTAYAAGTDYNATNNGSMNYTVTGGGNVNDRVGQTFAFKDETNDDFHLEPSDAGARNRGADLSVTSPYLLTLDADEQTRSGTWDIGADEAAVNVYYSVGQDPADHKSGGAGLQILTLISGLATFSAAQVSNSLGVGDVVTYAGGTAYIAGKTSPTEWTLVTATGGTPPDVAGVVVTSITHAFTSLAAAIAGAGALLGSTNLHAANAILNLPCYYDLGSDTTAVEIPTTWITASSNFIKIYAPNDTASEVNLSQRHAGTWSATKYNLVTSAAALQNAALTAKTGHIWIDGLQIHDSRAYDYLGGISLDLGEVYSDANVRISNNLLKGTGATGGTGHSTGVRLSAPNHASQALKAWNNMIYDFNHDVSNNSNAIWLSDSYGSIYAYNNTVHNCTHGLVNASTYGTFIAKNNLLAEILSYAAIGTFAAGTDYNATDKASMNYTVTGAGNTHDRLSQTFTFTNVAGDDFHLNAADGGAKDFGVSLVSDTNAPFSTDIDGAARGGSWDIGADEN